MKPAFPALSLSPLRLLLLLLAFLGICHPARADDFLPPEQAFQATLVTLDAHTVEIRYQMARGYYLYREKFRVRSEAGPLSLDPLPPGKKKHDDNFGDVEVFYGEVAVRARTPADAPLPGEIQAVSQGCADDGLCYPPYTHTLAVTAPTSSPTSTPTNASTPADPAAAASPDDSADYFAGLLARGNHGLTLGLFFLAGLALAFTPCMLPMLPILSGILVGAGGQENRVSHGRGFALALAYVLAMGVIYALVGVAAGFTGTLLVQLLQNAWVLGAMGLLFVFLAGAMFGFYELQAPSFLQTRLSEQAGHIRGGSLAGAAAMGALSALIVGPCVAAPLAGALIYIGKTGDAVLGGSSLFALALGMGTPLLAVGASAGSLIPRPGPWMVAVKQAFGVVLLATAWWLVGPVLPAALAMGGWALLCIIPAIYLKALEPLPTRAGGWLHFWKGIGIALLLYGAALTVGLLAGSRDPLQPLRPFFATAAQAAPESAGPRFTRVRSVAELDAYLAKGQPTLLDFYADWCVSCKEMARLTFTDPAVAARMAGLQLLQADVTANGPEDAALLKRFGLYGPPGIILFDAQGSEQRAHRVVGFQKPERFLQSLEGIPSATGS